MSDILWQPTISQIAASQMMRFMHHVNKIHRLSLENYFDLYAWSIAEKAAFWKSIWDFFAIKASKQAETICLDALQMRNTKWFVGTELNFAENLLRRSDDHLAIIFNNEKNSKRTLTYTELKKAVGKVAAYLRSVGIKANDTVAAALPNIPETVIIMLAAASLGAIFSSCSPEFGQDALYDRFSQIKPTVLFMTDGYFYRGNTFNQAEKILHLREKISSIKEVVLITYADVSSLTSVTHFSNILQTAEAPLEFLQLPFDHPLCILYSSGTTGMPKCIVHGAGGTLLQHLKELALHTNITSDDRVFYYTSSGWMMWNWYVSSLALGATIAQYDGAAFYPHTTKLFDFIDENDIHVFGTSAKYLSTLQKQGFHPKLTHHLSSLKTILSTGSPLLADQFDYVYQSIKSELCLSSISGGTDIISCFVLGNPILPVYRGEIQCIGLGMHVKIFNAKGQPVIGEKGELVCVEAFPSMPVCFWNDPDGKKYQQTYFSTFENVWTHGDYAEITARNTAIIYGRSDTTLNPGGVRIGTAEIYRQVEKIEDVAEALAVEQEWENDTRIILFVILKDNVMLTDTLKTKIETTIRQNLSPRHVPAKIISVTDFPRTINGKVVELAVREIINSRPVKNIGSIVNPLSLDNFKQLK